jgi:hypothetical protein
VKGHTKIQKTQKNSTQKHYTVTVCDLEEDFFGSVARIIFRERGLCRVQALLARSRIHERTVLLRLLGIILRVPTLEFSAYNVYITNQFQTTVAQVVDVNSKEENSSDFCPNYFQEFGLRLRFFAALDMAIHFLSSIYTGCILCWSSCRGLIVLRYRAPHTP